MVTCSNFLSERVSMYSFHFMFNSSSVKCVSAFANSATRSLSSATFVALFFKPEMETPGILFCLYVGIEGERSDAVDAFAGD